MILASCSAPGHVIQTADRNIVSIQVLEETIPESIVEGKFDEAGIKARIAYSDGTTEDIAVNSNLLGSTYAPLVNEAGLYIVSILYRGVDLTFQINIVKPASTIRFYAYEDSPTYALVSTQEIPYKSSAVPPTVAQDIYDENIHYTFSGWDRAYDSITQSSDIYALYDRVNWYTVRFYDGQNNLIDSQVLDESDDAVVPTNYAMEGYEFIGWDRDYHNVTQNLEIRGLYFKASGQAEIDNPSTDAPTPIENLSIAHVEIVNKEALQADWPLEETSRRLSLYLAPKANVLEAIEDGSLVIASSDESVLSVSGINLLSVSSGEATITVTYRGSSDSVKIVVGPYTPGLHPNNPLTPTQAIAIAQDMRAGESTSSSFYIKGYVTAIIAAYSYAYSNVTFYLGTSTESAQEESFYVYRIGAPAELGASIIKGAEVMIQCAITNYNGTTPENSGGAVISAEGGSAQVRPTGHGWEEDDPFTVAEALERCATLDANVTDEFECYVKGAVSEIESKTGGSLTCYIVDAADGNPLYIYQLALAEDDAARVVKDTEVVVKVQLRKYASMSDPSKPERLVTAAGGTLVSAEGGSFYVPKTGHGWEEADPFTVTEAIAEGVNPEQEMFVKGYVVSIKSAYSAQYGNISVMIADSADEADTAKQMQCFRTAVTQEIAEQLVVGARATFQGKMFSYNNVFQLAQGNVVVGDIIPPSAS